MAVLRKPGVDDGRDRRISANELKHIVETIKELRAPWFKWLFLCHPLPPAAA